MTSSHRFRVIWARKHWLLLAAVIAAAAAYGISSTIAPTYRAESTVAIVPSQQVAGSQLSDATLQQLAVGYVELARSRPVLNEARALGHIAVPSNRLLEMMDISTEPGGVLRLGVEARRASDAAGYVNALSAGLVHRIDQVESLANNRALRRIEQRLAVLRTQLDKARQGGGEATAIVNEIQQLSIRAADVRTRPTTSARLVETATPPSSPASPRPIRNAIIGFIGALLLGAAAIYFFVATSSRYETGEEASRDLDLPLLAELPEADADNVDALDAFRGLRTNVAFAMGLSPAGRNHKTSPNPARGSVRRGRAQALLGARRRSEPANSESGSKPDGAVLLVTSADPEAGKTYVTSNLARAFARDGHRVVAVDGDMRRPTLHEHLAIAREPGLSEALSGAASPNGVPTRTVDLPEAARQRGGTLEAIASGKPAEESSELLSSGRMIDVVRQLSERFAVAVVDSTPVLGVADATVAGRYADGAILVVDARHTPRHAARRAVQLLRSLDVPLIGLVFNRVSPEESYYGYRYGYHAASSEPEPAKR